MLSVLLLLLLAQQSEDARSRLICLRVCLCRSTHLSSATHSIMSGLSRDCDACQGHFASFLEATRVEYPLVEMTDQNLSAVVFHLVTCALCLELYLAQSALTAIEERCGA